MIYQWILLLSLSPLTIADSAEQGMVPNRLRTIPPWLDTVLYFASISGQYQWICWPVCEQTLSLHPFCSSNTHSHTYQESFTPSDTDTQLHNCSPDTHLQRLRTTGSRTDGTMTFQKQTILLFDGKLVRPHTKTIDKHSMIGNYCRN